MKKIILLLLFPVGLLAQDKLPFYDIDLIKQFYTPTMITEDGGGIYSTENYDYKVTVEKKYVFDERASYWDSKRIKTIIVLFKNVPINKQYDILDCHACSGFLGLAKYQYENDKWRLKNFTDNCKCGSASYGKITIPDLEEYEGVHFLVYHSFYAQHGVSTERVAYHNTYTFHKSLAFIKAEDNFGQEEKGSPNAYSFNTDVVFFKNKEGQLSANYIRTGRIPLTYKNIKNANQKIIYVYDTRTNSFLKQ